MKKKRKDVETECCAKSLMMLRSGWVISSRRVAGSGAEEDVLEIIRALGSAGFFEARSVSPQLDCFFCAVQSQCAIRVITLQV